MDEQLLQYLLEYAWSGIQSQGYNPAQYSATRIIEVLSVEIEALRSPLSPLVQEFTRRWTLMCAAARS